MEVLFKRGTTSQNDSYVGPLGSITIDTDKKKLRVHDGSTPGGVELPISSEVYEKFDKADGLPTIPFATISSSSEITSYSTSGSSTKFPHLAGFRDGSGEISFSLAVQKASEYGARLATIEELEDGVTSGTGYGYDGNITWSCSVAGPGKVWGILGSGSGNRVLLDVANDLAMSGYVVNKYVAADSIYLEKIKRVHGAGSGLDSDTVDGKHASAFSLAGHTHDTRYYQKTEVNTKSEALASREELTQAVLDVVQGLKAAFVEGS